MFSELQKAERAWLQIGSSAWQPNDFRGERLLAMAYGDTYAAETFIAFSHNRHYGARLRLLPSNHPENFMTEEADHNLDALIALTVAVVSAYVSNNPRFGKSV
ncbi:hypothetical protein [Mesorhizobium sp.]|uniref:hypothetical protein n=1 Tax=Mesorhizobium sp. TaxID=1871066 RepID=UPI0025DAA4BB|nr:hypothetical protein [Mesorhizobium sp.]